MRRVLLSLSLGVALLTTSGCAGNKLRVEAAGEVRDSADAFVEQAHDALDDAKARRLRANAALVASDVTCVPLKTIRVRTAGTGSLCPSGTRPHLPVDFTAIELHPISEEALKPTIILIGAVGDYGAALGKIVDKPNVDISAELGSIAAKAGSALALSNALLGTRLPDLEKELASDQGVAAAALIQFVADLAVEQRKVRDINRLVAERGDKVEAILPKLRRQMKNWIIVSGQGDAQIYESSLTQAYANQRRNWDFDQRYSFATRVNEARADAAAAPMRMATLDEALEEFQKAQATLRRMLLGDFTAEEKRRMSRIATKRMAEALNLMAKTVVAFGGP